MDCGLRNFEDVNSALIGCIPDDQRARVFGQDMCDIGPDFLGFVRIYAALAAIIPLHWTVIDLGCAYAPQAFLFEEHARYIGVDFPDDTERFSAPNTRHYHMPIEEFIAKHAGDFDQKTTFAICSYVPPWGGDNSGRVRAAFANVFAYYPAGESVKCVSRK